MRRFGMIGFALLTGVALFASVPNRITYQGRLSKNSSPVIGLHTFGVRIYPSATPASSLWQDLNIPVTLGPEGEFTIVLEIGDIDWVNADPRLEITVDGEKLSPTDSFETTPYSFVAKRVDAGGVNTAALADGAVTNAKVAVGVAASKILLTTNTYLSDWRHPTQLDKIDAAKVFPPLAVDSIIFSSPSVAQFIQASQPVTPLTVKGKSGVVGTVPVFDVKDNNDVLRLRVRGAGEQYLSGPVGVGTEAPGAPLDIVSSSASVVLRNTQAPEASRTWQVAVNNLGKMNIQATNASLGTPVSALALSRDGSVDIPTARISSSTIQNLTSTNLVTQNLNSENLVAQSLTATSLGFGTVTASSLTVQNLSAITSAIQNLSSTNMTASSATIGQLISTNFNASAASIGTANINSFGAPVSGGLTVDNLTVNNSIGFPVVAGMVSGVSSLTIGVGQTQITFQTETFDSSNIFDPAFPSRLKAPRKGLYLVNYSLLGESLGICVIRKNGVEIFRSYPPEESTMLGLLTISQSVPLLLNQNDYVEVYAQRATTNASLTTRSFQLTLLGLVP